MGDLPTSLPRGWGAPVAVLAGVAGALAAARLTLLGALPGRECLWLRWTGIPCPGCGATRCLNACGGFQITEALRWNPLAAVTVLALLAWSALALADIRFAKKTFSRIAGFSSPARLAVLVAFNWLYLCWMLPR